MMQVPPSVPKIDLSRISGKPAAPRRGASSSGVTSDVRKLDSVGLRCPQSASYDGSENQTTHSRRRSGPLKPRPSAFFSIRSQAKAQSERSTTADGPNSCNAPRRPHTSRPASVPLSHSLDTRHEEYKESDELKWCQDGLFDASTKQVANMPSPEFVAFLERSSSLSSSTISSKIDLAQLPLRSDLEATTPPPVGPVQNVREDLSLSLDKLPNRQTRRSDPKSEATLGEQCKQAACKKDKAKVPSPSRKPKKSILRAGPADESAPPPDQDEPLLRRHESNLDTEGCSTPSPPATNAEERTTPLSPATPPEPEQPRLEGCLSACSPGSEAPQSLGIHRRSPLASPMASDAVASPSLPLAEVPAKPISSARLSAANEAPKTRPRGSAWTAGRNRAVRRSGPQSDPGSGGESPAASPVASGQRRRGRGGSAKPRTMQASPLLARENTAPPSSSQAAAAAAPKTSTRSSARAAKPISAPAAVAHETSAPSAGAAPKSAPRRAALSAGPPAYAQPTAASARRSRTPSHPAPQPRPVTASKSCPSIPSNARGPLHPARPGCKPPPPQRRGPPAQPQAKLAAPCESKRSTARVSSARGATTQAASSDAAAAAAKAVRPAGRSKVGEDKEGPAARLRGATSHKPQEKRRRAAVSGRGEGDWAAKAPAREGEEALPAAEVTRTDERQEQAADSDVRGGSAVERTVQTQSSDVGNGEGEWVMAAPKGVTFRDGADDVFEYTAYFSPAQAGKPLTGPEIMRQLHKETAGLTPAEILQLLREKRAESGKPVPTIVDDFDGPRSSEEELYPARTALLKSISMMSTAKVSEDSEAGDTGGGYDGGDSLAWTDGSTQSGDEDGPGLGQTLGRGGLPALLGMREGDASWSEDDSRKDEWESSGGAESLEVSGDAGERLGASESFRSEGSEATEGSVEVQSTVFSESETDAGDASQSFSVELGTTGGDGEEGEAEGEQPAMEEEEEERAFVVLPHRLRGYREKFLGEREELEALDKEMNEERGCRSGAEQPQERGAT